MTNAVKMQLDINVKTHSRPQTAELVSLSNLMFIFAALLLLFLALVISLRLRSFEIRCFARALPQHIRKPRNRFYTPAPSTNLILIENQSIYSLIDTPIT